MKKYCKICGQPMTDNYRHDECKDCKKKCRKAWWKKNWPWVTLVALFSAIVVKDVLDNSEGTDISDEGDFDEGVTTAPIEEAEETYGGVPLSKLNVLAKNVYHGLKVTVDQYGFLVFHYTSNSGKTKFDSQIELSEDNKLVSLGGHYPGQWYSSADDFVKKANELFTFENDITQS